MDDPVLWVLRKTTLFELPIVSHCGQSEGNAPKVEEGGGQPVSGQFGSGVGSGVVVVGGEVGGPAGWGLRTDAEFEAGAGLSEFTDAEGSGREDFRSRMWFTIHIL